jgi:pimeloyl-ACP methyl ester carboxylesterase
VDVKQVDAGLLNVGYVDAGPSDGPAVLLLHGWPYDIHSYAEVTPCPAAAGSGVSGQPGSEHGAAVRELA